MKITRQKVQQFGGCCTNPWGPPCLAHKQHIISPDNRAWYQCQTVNYLAGVLFGCTHQQDKCGVRKMSAGGEEKDTSADQFGFFFFSFSFFGFFKSDRTEQHVRNPSCSRTEIHQQLILMLQLLTPFGLSNIVVSDN